MIDLTVYSVAELAHAVRNKDFSAREAVESHLHRIGAVNSHLNAVVALSPSAALAEAERADAALARGEIWGPLHGVPMTIKDNLDTAGAVSTGGTKGRAAFVPQRDAAVVARLRRAGAILLGKTNTPELTMAYETENLVYGRTSNPHNLALTSGGSSGGAAAIVAVGGSPFDIGSDTGEVSRAVTFLRHRRVDANRRSGAKRRTHPSPGRLRRRNDDAWTDREKGWRP